jgi:hypothetical protein
VVGHASNNQAVKRIEIMNNKKIFCTCIECKLKSDKADLRNAYERNK